MQLDLVGDRHGQACCRQLLDVLDAEVAHADRPRLALPLQLDEPAPLGEPVVSFERRMDQVEVYVVQPQPLEAPVERRHRGLGGPGDEERLRPQRPRDRAVRAGDQEQDTGRDREDVDTSIGVRIWDIGDRDRVAGLWSGDCRTWNR